MLDHVFSEKDFEVIFDSDLSFEQHIFYQGKEANSMVGIIKRSSFHLTPDLFPQLYYNICQTPFKVAQVIWSQKLQKHSKLVKGVQRRATRIVEACKHQPYSNQLQQIGDMLEVYKDLHFYDSKTVPSKLVARNPPSRNHKFELKRAFDKDGLRRVNQLFLLPKYKTLEQTPPRGCQFTIHYRFQETN